MKTLATNRGVAITLVVALALWFVPSLQEGIDFPVFYLLFGYTLFQEYYRLL